MKLNEILFVAGIALLIIGAGTALLPIIGAGALVFVVGLIIRFITRPAGEETIAEADTDEFEG